MKDLTLVELELRLAAVKEKLLSFRIGAAKVLRITSKELAVDTREHYAWFVRQGLLDSISGLDDAVHALRLMESAVDFEEPKGTPGTDRRALAQQLIAEIGVGVEGPESLEETVSRAAKELRDLYG